MTFDPNEPHRPAPAQPLGYEVPTKDWSRTPFWLQVIFGVGAWVAGMVFVGVMVSGLQSSVTIAGMSSTVIAILIVGLVLGTLGGLTVWLRIRYRWRGFLPGLLLGLGIFVLVPIGIVAVVCGAFK